MRVFQMFVYYLNALLELSDVSVPDVCILFECSFRAP